MPPVTRVPRVVRAADGKDAKSRAYAHYGWFNYWRRPHASIATRGTLEFDFLVITAADPHVADIRRPRKAIRYWDGDSWAGFMPHFEVRVVVSKRAWWRSFAIFVAEDAASRSAMLKRVERDARAVGRDFAWVTHRQIRAEPRLTNSKLILAQAGEKIVGLEDLNAVRSFARTADPFTLADVVRSGALDYERAYRAALNLISRGEMTIVHDRYFDGETPIARRTDR